jgi:DNA-binding transcriptional ArsR family regulator
MTDELSLAFGALADPTRRDIVVRLTEGDATVTSLAERYDLTLQAVSKHVKVLQAAGLVTKTAQAQRRHVHLEPAVLDLMGGWIRRYQRAAEARYRRLDDVLAQMSGAAAEEEIA